MLVLLLDEGGSGPAPLPLPPEYDGEHVVEGQALLLEQFKNSGLLQALLESWTATIQTTEDLMAPLVLSRDVETATGATLDSLGQAVGAERSGLADDIYRLFIKAKVLVNGSSGTSNELIAIVRQLAGDPILGVLVDEYNPATVFVRPQDFAIEDNADIWGALLQLAKSAGIRLQFVYSSSATDDNNLFRFSDSPTVPEFSSTKGFGSGTLTGVIG